MASLCRGRPADEAWRLLSSHLSPAHPFAVHETLYRANYSSWNEAEHGPPPSTLPDPIAVKNTAAADFMRTWDSPAWLRRRRELESKRELMEMERRNVNGTKTGGSNEDDGLIAHAHAAAAAAADDFRALHAASVEDPASFWAHVARRSGVVVEKEENEERKEAPPPGLGLGGFFLRFDPSAPGGSERWLPDARMNIAEACFLGKHPDSPALVWSRQQEEAPAPAPAPGVGPGRPAGAPPVVRTVTRIQLRARADAVAASLCAAGLGAGRSSYDGRSSNSYGGNAAAAPSPAVAVVLPLTAECVPLYLGIVLAGAAVVCIPDSFAPEEIATRLAIGSAAAVVTQDDVVRDGRRLTLYPRVAAAADRAVAAAAERGGEGGGGGGGGRGVIPAVVMACAAESCGDVWGEVGGGDGGDSGCGSSSGGGSATMTYATGSTTGPRGGGGARLSGPLLRRCDVSYADFLRRGYVLSSPPHAPFKAVRMPASSPTAILFSSGTTGTPKAIPWDHVAPLHGISDGNLHMDVKPGDVAVWPTNLGWMMGSWLIYQLVNGAAVGIFEGSPTTRQFGEFVSAAKVTMLGLVPSIVASWRASGCMEGLDWSPHLRSFALTGEASSPSDTQWLASRIKGYSAPVLEYCGGTELASGYACSAVSLPNAPSCFSSQSLGGSFVLLVEDNTDDGDGGDGDGDGRRRRWREAGEVEVNVSGEVAVRTPYLGSSTSLLNGDNHAVYYRGMPRAALGGVGGVGGVGALGAPLRRHGDRFERLPRGYYRAAGRTDDAFNLGGIKTSSVELERVCNAAAVSDDAGGRVLETAAVAVPPPEGGPERLWIIAVPMPKGASSSSKGGKDENEEEEEALLDPSALRAVFAGAVRRGLNPLFHVHRVIIAPEGLPRNASNKIVRRVLRGRCAEVQEREEREKKKKNVGGSKPTRARL